MLCVDNIREISKYASKRSLLMLLSTCKEYRNYDHIYYDIYAIYIGNKHEILNCDLNNSKITVFLNKIKKIRISKKSSIHPELLIQSFPNLKWLSVDYHDNHLYSHHEIYVVHPNINILKIKHYVKEIAFKPFSKLTSLDIFYYNGKLEDILPHTLKKLKITSGFNGSVNKLPSGLEELILGNNFNQSVDNLPNLKKLILGNKFDQSIDMLSDSIEILNIGNHNRCSVFRQNINKLPKNLRTFKFHSYNYSFYSNIQNIKICDLDKLQYLEELHIIGYNIEPINKFPKTLKYLTYTSNTINLQEIEFHDGLVDVTIYINNIISVRTDDIIVFPDSIQTLVLRRVFHKILFPQNLKKLTIYDGCSFDTYDLPESLEYLAYYKYNYHLNDNYKLPVNLKILEFPQLSDDETKTLPYFPQLKQLRVACNDTHFSKMQKQYGIKLKRINYIY